MQVKALEEQAGLPLFEQIGKKIFLTKAGKELHVRCRAVSDELRAAEEALKAMRGIEQGKLTVGIVSTGKYFVPQLLGRFLQAHPGVTFKLSVNNREVVLRELAENELDLASMGRPPQNIDAVAESFAKHPHVVVAPRRIPLSRSGGSRLRASPKSRFSFANRAREHGNFSSACSPITASH